MNSIFIAIDGNNIGRKIEYLILDEKLEELQNFSNEISHRVRQISHAIESTGGKIFMSGGDNILAEISNTQTDFLIDVLKKNQTDRFTFSMGIGNNTKMAYLALKCAKAMNLEIYVME